MDNECLAWSLLVLVLDTHVLIWWLCKPGELSAKARKAIAAAAQDKRLLVSAISILEITTLVRRGRLQFNVPVEHWLADFRKLPEFRITPVNADIAQLAGSYANDMPGDPAARLIAATAATMDIPLVTADEKMRSNKSLVTLW